MQMTLSSLSLAKYALAYVAAPVKSRLHVDRNGPGVVSTCNQMRQPPDERHFFFELNNDGFVIDNIGMRTFYERNISPKLFSKSNISTIFLINWHVKLKFMR